jgi:hypothetical protein
MSSLFFRRPCLPTCCAPNDSSRLRVPLRDIEAYHILAARTARTARSHHTFPIHPLLSPLCALPAVDARG